MLTILCFTNDIIIFGKSIGWKMFTVYKTKTRDAINLVANEDVRKLRPFSVNQQHFRY